METPVTPMRNLTRTSLIAVAALALCFTASSVRAQQVLSGSFTLPQATHWANNTLPAGNYSLSVAETSSGRNILIVRGEHQVAQFTIQPTDKCSSCRSGALMIQSGADARSVVALDLPGYHVNFSVSKSARMEEASNRKTERQPIQLQGGTN
jgi:hypothetical protein